MRILIADDDLTSRTVLAAVLRKVGYEVTQTADGAEAWEELQKPDAPRMAVLDWMMPVMDGLEVVRRVRALPTDQPPYIIMLTSKGEKADIIAGLDNGADDYLAKPFNTNELRARVGVGRRLVEMQSELRQARNALAHQATHDPLTGILNRRAVESSLARELAREQRHHNGLAVGICDIDHFKKVNDTYGHPVGDEVLCGVVRLLEDGLREYDCLARVGGEEFLVITPDVRAGGADELFGRLRETVEHHPIPTRAGQVSVTISIGVRIVQEDDTLDALLAAADTALYRAKNTGRNRVCLDGGALAGQDGTRQNERREE
jgi:two-component system, cell cycle response regulator